ncbi:FMN-binding negative transcriptional regulator [Rhodoferax sp.]|uniref:FMN-binding negative transcriptional regulator n=1 Tax=Rhodoferax sp. TaxID=50421 RepID=UPI0026206357|nr:FMN-binding negative transcriptional regulator [Rhodoferax sp.]MDD2811100.1 FMN-binding negative transcriptional regulator [Rhodoferax sp.]
MYLPQHFEETRPEVLHAVMAAHPLASLVTVQNGLPCLDEIPFLLSAGDAGPIRLQAHVARANPLWQRAANTPVLVVFRGPQAYISPSWYAAKAEHGKVVPTWNYVLVQARGILRVVDDADWLRAQVQALTRSREDSRAAPWQVSDAPADYVAQMLRAIVGIEVTVEALTGKWKVSQNRNEADRTGVALGLRQEPGDQTAEMAEWVSKQLL